MKPHHTRIVDLDQRTKLWGAKLDRIVIKSTVGRKRWVRLTNRVEDRWRMLQRAIQRALAPIQQPAMTPAPIPPTPPKERRVR